jgi:ABC-2 type transport system ATP-binding protein
VSTVADVAIRTDGLAKHYGELVALADLDLEVPTGVIFGFLGPNGAGKSTLIRLLVGLLKPTAGAARVLGHDIVTDRQALHREVGYLPGDFTADKDLTAEEYLRYLANLRGDVDEGHVTALADRFGLPLGKPIRALSHGNRQKVGIVQAFMHRPPLVLLDEPTQGLDPLMQREFMELVRAHRDAGGTVFLSSHVLSEVQELADRVAIVRQGRLVMTAGVDELRAAARHHVVLTLEDGVEPPLAELEALGSVSEVASVDGTVQLTVEGSMADVMRLIAPLGVEQLVSEELDLESLFLSYYDEEG